MLSSLLNITAFLFIITIMMNKPKTEEMMLTRDHLVIFVSLVATAYMIGTIIALNWKQILLILQ